MPEHLDSNCVAIDPSYTVFNNNELFNSSSIWNRDDHLTPFHRLRSFLAQHGINVNTADKIFENPKNTYINYFSFGILRDYKNLIDKGEYKLNLRSFVIMEPPIVACELYDALPTITKHFANVYLHNSVGDGYSLDGVDQSKLRTLYWPQPYFGVIEKLWSSADRLNRVVVVNGNHRPRLPNGELYSKRIEAMSKLAEFDAVDLYGKGWDKLLTRNSFWLPYLMNRKSLLSIHKGAATSKYETLSRYRFCLCFENMEMSGYVTEKIFDSLYAGTIPLYLGAPNIASLIPPEAYIDCRKFLSWEEMWQKVSTMSESEITALREAGKAFLSSEEFLKYYNSLQDIVIRDAEFISINPR